MVVDASVLVHMLLRTPLAEAVDRKLFESRRTLHAPHLLDIEVAQVVRRYVAGGEIDAPRGRTMLEYLALLGVERYPHGFLLPRVWELRHNLTAYDAVYVALAEALDAPLVTGDLRMAAVAERLVKVEVVGPSGAG